MVGLLYSKRTTVCRWGDEGPSVCTRTRSVQSVPWQDTESLSAMRVEKRRRAVSLLRFTVSRRSSRLSVLADVPMTRSTET